MKLIPALVATALLLAGCTAAPAQVITVTAPAATPTTPEAATAQQFASIIAGKESDWRETIADASDCRFLWVTGASDSLEEVEAITCYVREATVVVSTGSAAREIRALTPPDELNSLVDETLAVLDDISSVKLEEACGEPFDMPNDSDECSTTLGDLNWNYGTLEDVLDKWKPYT